MSTQQRGFIVPSASMTRYFLGDVHSTKHTDTQTGIHSRAEND